MSWDFGDGTTARGLRAGHSFTAPGLYDVTLTIDLQGQHHVTSTRVAIASPVLIALDPAAGRLRYEDTGATQRLPVALHDPDGSGPAAAREAVVLATHAASHTLGATQVPSIFGAEDFRVSLSLAADNWSQDAGEILRLHRTFILNANKDGTLTVNLSPEGGPRVVLKSTLALKTGDWSDVTLHFDGNDGRVWFEIDGQQAGEAKAAGFVSKQSTPGFSLGAIYGSSSFTGAISAIEIAADEGHYAAFRQPAAALAPAVPDNFAGFDMRDALAQGSRAVALKGNAVLTATGTVRLDGDRDHVMLERNAETNPTGQTLVQVDYHRDLADGAYARLAWNHQRLTVSTQDDALIVQVRLASDKMKTFRIDDLGLNDTDWHRVTVAADETADSLAVAVDGTLVLQRNGQEDLQITEPGLQFWAWNLGGMGSGWLDGEIGTVRIDADRGDLAGVQLTAEAYDTFLF